MSALRLFVVGAVEEFDHVEDLLSGAELLDAGAQLQDAAGVGGDDNVGAGGAGMFHFFG